MKKRRPTSNRTSVSKIANQRRPYARINYISLFFEQGKFFQIENRPCSEVESNMTKAKIERTIESRLARRDFWGIRNMFPVGNLKNVKIDILHFALERADLYHCEEIWAYLEQVYRKKVEILGCATGWGTVVWEKVGCYNPPDLRGDFFYDKLKI